MADKDDMDDKALYINILETDASPAWICENSFIIFKSARAIKYSSRDYDAQ